MRAPRVKAKHRQFQLDNHSNERRFLDDVRPTQAVMVAIANEIDYFIKYDLSWMTEHFWKRRLLETARAFQIAIELTEPNVYDLDRTAESRAEALEPARLAFFEFYRIFQVILTAVHEAGHAVVHRRVYPLRSSPEQYLFFDDRLPDIRIWGSFQDIPSPNGYAPKQSDIHRQSRHREDYKKVLSQIDNPFDLIPEVAICLAGSYNEPQLSGTVYHQFPITTRLSMGCELASSDDRDVDMVRERFNELIGNHELTTEVTWDEIWRRGYDSAVLKVQKPVIHRLADALLQTEDGVMYQPAMIEVIDPLMIELGLLEPASVESMLDVTVETVEW